MLNLLRDTTKLLRYDSYEYTCYLETSSFKIANRGKPRGIKPLEIKHWQVFLILLIGAIASNFTIIGDKYTSLAINIFGFAIYFLWNFILGLELTERLPHKVELPRILFIINFFVLLISMSIITIVFDGHYESSSFYGFLWIIYLMFALIQFLSYPGKALKTIEINRKASFGEYFKYFLLMIFWPVGIWWIQPKLNKLIDSETRIQVNS